MFLASITSISEDTQKIEIIGKQYKLCIEGTYGANMQYFFLFKGAYSGQADIKFNLSKVVEIIFYDIATKEAICSYSRISGFGRTKFDYTVFNREKAEEIEVY